MTVPTILRQAWAGAVVVHNHLKKIRLLAELRIVLRRPIERRERIVVPDVPTHAFRRRNAVGESVRRAIGVVESFVPQTFPGEQLGILHQPAPESNEGAVRWPLSAADRRRPALEFQ